MDVNISRYFVYELFKITCQPFWSSKCWRYYNALEGRVQVDEMIWYDNNNNNTNNGNYDGNNDNDNNDNNNDNNDNDNDDNNNNDNNNNNSYLKLGWRYLPISSRVVVHYYM